MVCFVSCEKKNEFIIVKFYHIMAKIYSSYFWKTIRRRQRLEWNSERDTSNRVIYIAESTRAQRGPCQLFLAQYWDYKSNERLSELTV